MNGKLMKCSCQPLPWFWGFGNILNAFGNGKGWWQLDVFCTFGKVAIVIMSKFCKIYSWNFLDKYGSTRGICFTISFWFGSREREWSICWFDFFSFFSFQIFLLVHIFVKWKCLLIEHLVEQLIGVSSYLQIW